MMENSNDTAAHEPVALLPCPFCGGEAEFDRMGTPRQSCVVQCRNCGATHESSDEGDECGESWNRRAHPEARPPREHEGEVTVVCNEAGECVAVTRTDDEHRILKVIWERPTGSGPAGTRIVELEAALTRILAYLHQPNPIDPTVWYVRPRLGKEFSAAIVAARAVLSGIEQKR